jgi:hypothetical protein
MRDRLLVRHFLERFLDHDLISPEADRREVLTVTAAMSVASMLCLAVFVAAQYQFSLFLPPGMTSVLSLDDRFLYCSVSLIVMALIAVAEWDALALDARDTAVLGPLPIARWAIVRAKFAAVAMFAVGFDVALSIGPTVLRIGALPAKLPVTWGGALRLTVAQGICATAAGAFGFVAVLGFRETCRALIGAKAFARLSGGLQAGLLVVLVTALLLVPRSFSSVATRWLVHGRVPPQAVPPLWFVGLHETLAGRVIDRLPHANPVRRFAAAERVSTTLYRSLWPLFHQLAGIAVVGTVATLAAAALACTWNHRRLPMPAARGARRRRLLTRACIWLATRLIVRRPAAQAGFFFTLQALARSVPHRITIAAAVAVALSLAVITGGSLDARRTASFVTIPVRLLAVQTWLLMVLLAALRHVVRLPAEVRANWVFHLAWSGDDRPYVLGVKRAVLCAIVIPALFFLFIWHAMMIGVALAVEHLAVGAALAVLLLQLLFVGYRKLPFATTYVRTEDLKLVVPVFAVGTLIAGAAIAAIERAALASAAGALAFLAVLIALIAIVSALDAARRRTEPPFALEELSADPTQRLALIH